MSHNDDQNKDHQHHHEDANSEQPAREGRADQSQDLPQQNESNAPRPDQGSDLDDADEMDEEDRDDDQRSDGGSNRRSSIG